MEKKKDTQKIYAAFAGKAKQELFELFHVSTNGLTEGQIERSKENYGENAISYSKKTPFIVEILKAYITSFTLMLIALGIISFITKCVLAAPGDKDFFGVAIIFTMIIVNGIMTLVQSVRFNRTAGKLKSLVKVTATVKRNGKYTEIPVEEIVCGDLVRLSAGNMIPADTRLLSVKDSFISQAALAEESYLVEKHAKVCEDDQQSEISYENLVFMGSSVISGSAEGIIVSVGNETLFGHVAETLSEKLIQPSFELGTHKISMLLIKFMLLVASTVIVTNGLTKGDWLGAFLFGLSVAVGLTLEMLPMIVTTNLVKGASMMAKKGTVIKNLDAIQNFGVVDVLCTDKAGTLTQDKIILEYHIDCEGNKDNRVLHHAYLNSYYQTGLKNLLDVAIIDETTETLDIDKINYQKADEIPFDFERRRVSVVVADPVGKTQMATKGAIEEMLNIPKFIDLNGTVTPLTKEQKEAVLAKVQSLNEDGLRVIGVAQRTNPSVIGEFSVKDESDMVLIGCLTFLDPPEETTKQALKALKEYGVVVKVLIGDNELVTRSVCRQVGLEINELVTGEKISEMSDHELAQVAEDHEVFVKSNLQQKARLTTTLRKNGHTVGFLGDSINDAPTMEVAGIGISVDTAVDIAKESVDVIPLEKDLMILERGLLSGRETFGNIMKYIKATASSSFGNMFSILIASMFLPFLPMLPLQLLFLNLIYDVSYIFLSWDRIDKEYLDEPKKWNTSSTGKFVVYFGPTSSISDITTYLLMYLVICPTVVDGSFHTLDSSQQVTFIALLHAGWSVESLWAQTLVLHAPRAPRISFIQSNVTFVMFVITTLGIIVGSVLPFISFGAELGLTPLPGNHWLWLFATVIAYLTLVTAVRKIYIHRFQELL